MSDTFYESYIGRCARCRAPLVFKNVTVDASGTHYSTCPLARWVRNDDMLPPAGTDPLPYVRRICGGHIHQVSNHEAAVAAYKLGGEPALVAMDAEGQL